MLLPPADRPLLADIASRIFESDICEATLISPAILQEISRNIQQLQSLRRFKHVLWAGAPFTSPDVAQKKKSCVEIQPAYGSLEAGPFPLILEDQQYHDYMHFHPQLSAELPSLLRRLPRARPDQRRENPARAIRLLQLPRALRMADERSLRQTPF